MVDLILRPDGMGERKGKPWALQLRYHESLGETVYVTLCLVDDDTAKEIIRAGGAYWLFGEPNWDEIEDKRKLREAAKLREEDNGEPGLINITK